jgi:hypothetical protein
MLLSQMLNDVFRNVGLDLRNVFPEILDLVFLVKNVEFS